MVCPCKECMPPKRCIGCHSVCDEYKAWKKHIEDLKNNLHKKSAIDAFCYDIVQSKFKPKK